MGDEILDAEEDFVVGNKIENDGSDDWKIGGDESNSMRDNTHHGDFRAVQEEINKQEYFKGQEDKLNNQVKHNIRHESGSDGNHVSYKGDVDANECTDHIDWVCDNGGDEDEGEFPDVFERVVDEDQVGFVEVLAAGEVLFLERNHDVLGWSFDFGQEGW